MVRVIKTKGGEKENSSEVWPVLGVERDEEEHSQVDLWPGTEGPGC